jgi:hypothetical protein
MACGGDSSQLAETSGILITQLSIASVIYRYKIIWRQIQLFLLDQLAWWSS